MLRALTWPRYSARLLLPEGVPEGVPKVPDFGAGVPKGPAAGVPKGPAGAAGVPKGPEKPAPDGVPKGPLGFPKIDLPLKKIT